MTMDTEKEGWIEQENREVMLAGEEVVMLDASSSGDRVQPVELNQLRSQHPFLPIEPRPQLTTFANLAKDSKLSVHLNSDAQMVVISASQDTAMAFGGACAATSADAHFSGRQTLLPAGAVRRLYCAGLMSIDFLALSAGYISVEQYFQA